MWIENLNLSLKEKQKLKNVLNESRIVNINFMQNIIYLSLQNSKMVLLRNSTEELFKELKKNIEKSFLLREKIKKTNKRKASDWTEEEIEYLKYNFYDIDIDSLSLHLKKSQYQISLKAIEMKLVGAREWSSREIEYLEKNVDLPNYKLAKILKRSLSSVKAKKRVLRMRKGRECCDLAKKI